MSKEGQIRISDSDSKNFFDEVIEDHNDIDNMLIDFPTIGEDGLAMDYLEDDDEFEIK